tara:strand:+ start:3608 stop:3757 length:150 start_codon:yes stop_codon:yes gene_type:complete
MKIKAKDINQYLQNIREERKMDEIPFNFIRQLIQIMTPKDWIDKYESTF